MAEANRLQVRSDSLAEVEGELLGLQEEQRKLTAELSLSEAKVAAEVAAKQRAEEKAAALGAAMAELEQSVKRGAEMGGSSQKASVRFRDLQLSQWTRDHEEAYVQGLSRSLGVSPAVFGPVSTMAGSVVASVEFTCAAPLATTRDLLKSLSFDSALAGAKFDPPVIECISARLESEAALALREEFAAKLAAEQAAKRELEEKVALLELAQAARPQDLADLENELLGLRAEHEASLATLVRVISVLRLQSDSLL